MRDFHIDVHKHYAVTNFSITPTCGYILHIQMKANRPSQVLELGCGVSTMILSHELQQIHGSYPGEYFLVSIESEPNEVSKTRIALKSAKLNWGIHLRRRPLGMTDYGLWYTLEAEDFLPYDFVFVDGPAGYISRHARYPFFPHMVKFLKDGCTIVLDDFERRTEQESIESWSGTAKKYNKELTLEKVYPFEYGELEKKVAILKVRDNEIYS